MSDIVEREETPIEFVACDDEIEAIREAWATMESIVPLQGHHFYGTAQNGVYHACVESRGESWGLEGGSIPGGRFVRERLRGEPPAVYERIGPTVEALERAVDVDASRPVIEHYRRVDEIDILVPLA